MKLTLAAILWGGILLLGLTSCSGGGTEGADSNEDLMLRSRGNGPPFSLPTDIAIEADGQIVVIDGDVENVENPPAVLRVDLVSGDRSIVSDANTGSGPFFRFPMGIAVAADGQILVSDVGLGAVLRVDPVSGDRFLVSDFIKGTGPIWRPRSIAVEADGQIVVIDEGWDAVLRVDPVSGDRTILSGCIDPPQEFFESPCPGAVAGNGPRFDYYPVLAAPSLVVGADGSLLITDNRQLLRIDPVSGDRTVVSGCSEMAMEGPVSCIGEIIGDGLPVDFFDHVAVEADGHLVAWDRFERRLFRIDPLTGNRSPIPVAGWGSGPRLSRELLDPADLAVEPDGNLLTLGFYSPSGPTDGPLIGHGGTSRELFCEWTR